MCIIVDNNVAAALLLEKSPVSDWLFGARGRPKLVVGERLVAEIAANREVSRVIARLRQAGRLRHVAEAGFRASFCVSNDTHIIAIAISSGARTLCTNDKALMSDFKNPALIDKPRGRVYSRPEHRRLLGHTASCGVRT